MMFSYYGSKSKIARYYPEPAFDVIIEPFAGAANYSLWGDRWKRNIFLFDVYKPLIAVWSYLIQAKESDILALPDMAKGEDVRKHTQLIDAERWLIGFNINQGSVSPKNIASGFNGWNRTKRKIATNLYKIRHWQIAECSYDRIPFNDKATWFIDPPYQVGGHLYKHPLTDFLRLRQWIWDRQGQVIVCENTQASWLGFAPLVEIEGQAKRTTEAYWYRQNQILLPYQKARTL